MVVRCAGVGAESEASAPVEMFSVNRRAVWLRFGSSKR